VPGPQAVLRASLGYREMAGDLLWMRALVYFGQYFDARHDVPWLEGYADDILALAPQWRTPYYWAASVITFQRGTITEREARKSAAYLERGIARFPDDKQMLFLLAVRYLTDIKPASDKERDTMRVRGADLLARAARQEGAPAHWLQLAARVLTEEGRGELAYEALMEQFMSAEDPTRREVYRKQLDKMGSGDLAKAADRVWERFRAARERSAPYVPPTLFVLIGEGGGVPYDPAAVVDDPTRPVSEEGRAQGGDGEPEGGQGGGEADGGAGVAGDGGGSGAER